MGDDKTGVQDGSLVMQEKQVPNASMDDTQQSQSFFHDDRWQSLWCLNWQQMTKSFIPQENTHDKVHNASTDGTWQSPQGLNSMKIKHISHTCLLWNWLFFTVHASSAVKSVGTETS